MDSGAFDLKKIRVEQFFIYIFHILILAAYFNKKIAIRY